jgi:hypothetical protein
LPRHAVSKPLSVQLTAGSHTVGMKSEQLNQGSCSQDTTG